MALKIGSSDVSALYIGDRPVTALYLGDVQVWGGASGLTAPSLVKTSADGVTPATFRLTPVSPQTGDIALVRVGALPDLSDANTTSDTVDPGDITATYIDFSINLTDGTWYVNAGIQRGATIVWSDVVLTVTIGAAASWDREDGGIWQREDGTNWHREAA